MHRSERDTIRGSNPPKEAVVERLENSVSAPEPKVATRRTVALRLATATCLMAVVVMSGVIAAISIVQVANGVGNRDSIAYWTAGHLMLIGEDPYDAALTLKIEKSAGWTAEGFEIMRNPPVTFFLVAPLGFVSARTGEVIWLILLSASLTVSVRLLWIVLGRLWSAWYYVTKRNNWIWTNEGLLVMVVSVGCAPYAWFTDEALLVPAILAAVYRAEASGRSLLPFALISGVLLAELCKGYWITTPYLLW